MRKLKILMDKYVLSRLEANNPKLYRHSSRYMISIYYKISGLVRYKDPYFFYLVAIEVSRHCNRKCDYCPNKLHNIPNEFMSENIFKKAIEELKKIKYSGVVIYNFFNEPMLDSRLPCFIEYVRKELPNSIQTLVTNGDFLNIENALNFMELGLDKFIVTIHDKDSTKGLERLTPIKEILKEKMILQTSNDLVLTDFAGSASPKESKRVQKSLQCKIRELIITINGDIVLCCNDYHRRHVMGNIMNKSLIDIWKSYSNLRRNLLKENKVELDICKKCLGIDK